MKASSVGRYPWVAWSTKQEGHGALKSEAKTGRKSIDFGSSNIDVVVVRGGGKSGCGNV